MFQKKPPDPLTRYVDPTNELPTRELRLGEWYVRHRELLRMILTILLAVWSVVTIGYSGWQWGVYLAVGYAEDERLLKALARPQIPYEVMHLAQGAKDLAIRSVDVFQPTGSKYDLVAEVENPNERWYAAITYKFTYSGGATASAVATVLPHSERPVAVFCHKADAYPAGAELMIESVRWQRANPHIIPDVESYLSERLNFPITDVLFSSGDSVPRLTFDITNATAYSYWQPVFYVALQSGGVPQGFIYVSLDQFRAGEKRSVDLRLFSPGAAGSAIRLIPAFSVFDPSAYMPPE